MKLNTFTRMAVACAAVLSTASAFAVPEFTIDPSKIPGVTGFSSFNATSIQGNSSELLHYDNTKTTGNITGSGYVSFSGFTNDNTGIPVLSTASGLNFGTLGSFVGYSLYLTFDLVATVAPGQFGQNGSVNNLVSLNFKVYADPGATNTFTPASALGTGTEAKVNDNGTKDILLAEGTFLSGVAGIDGLGGAYLNSIQSFAVCTGAGTASIGGTTVPNADCTSAVGSAFFAAPTPFYSLAFDAFNNTSQGVQVNGNLAAVVSATGVVDFNRVPEPASLALVGAALAGVGLARRARKSNKSA